MPEPVLILGAVVTGSLCAVAVFAVARGGESLHLTMGWARAVGLPNASSSVRIASWAPALHGTRIREWLIVSIDRAGWRETPERVTAFAIAFSACISVLGVTSASFLSAANPLVLGLFGFSVGLGLCGWGLRSAIAQRRRRLTAELVPLLELLTLELSGGGNALSALGAVTMQVQGELAEDLRQLLIASQVSGSISFETRLLQYSEHIEIPALSSVATIVGASREYGTGVIQGVRALATDLRRAQRRDLITHSRRALNHVLLPAAVGVLLPFLAVLMFPAVTALQRSFH